MTRSTRSLYEDFHGDTARRTLRVGVKFGTHWLTAPGTANLLIPASLAIVGRLSAIEYDTRRDERTVFARHEFAAGSKPLLAAGASRGQVFLIGDRYRFTDRGIMDIDSEDRLIDDGGLRR